METTELKPSFARVFLKVGAMILGMTALWYVGAKLKGQSANTSDLESLVCIGFPFFVAVMWFAFVPRRFAYSENEITIQTILGACTYRWPMLDSYGPGRGVFMIQFEGDRQAYQIYAGAYAQADWDAFLGFLSKHFPERRTSFSSGARLLRKK